MSNDKKDLIVLGGGAAGLNVASAAAQLGLDVTLIEKQPALGGDCLHVGCVPSKTLIHSAKVANFMRHADEVGLDSVNPAVDLAKVNRRVKDVIDVIQEHDDPDRFRSYGCEVLFGDAQFIDPHTIQFEDREIQAKRFVIATGSSPAFPPIPGIEETDFITNETVFNLQQLPNHLLVLGAGIIGLEMAQAFVRLGANVTVVDIVDRLLPQIDIGISSLLKSNLEKQGIVFHLDVKVDKLSEKDNKKLMAITTNEDQSLLLEADQFLVATGRKANIDNLGLETIGIDFTARGIDVDARLRTKQKHIYAMGDVINSPYKLTHMAEYHAGIVITNAVFHLPKKVDYRAFPSVMYTDPELAMVGLNLAEAKARGLNPTVLSFSFKDVDRALTDNCTDGKISIVVNKNRIIGATILGPHAGELIAEIVLAMQAKIKIGHLSSAVHAYPTLSQINRRAINTYYGKKLFSPRVKKLVRWLNKIF